jgi:hypothetical protein
VGYGKWINGNDYEQTQEVFGILPFDAAVSQDLGMLQYSEQFVKKITLGINGSVSSNESDLPFCLSTPTTNVFSSIFMPKTHHFLPLSMDNLITLVYASG